MKKTLVILLALVLSAPIVSAQEEKPVHKDYTRGWYVGAQAGMPMAEADFSSFGADKRVLGQWLIPADRVETVGGGIKRDAASEAEARNASTIEIMK